MPNKNLDILFAYNIHRPFDYFPMDIGHIESDKTDGHKDDTYQEDDKYG